MKKTVVITGASSGIGFECAKFFAQQGADLWMLSKDIERGEKALQTLRTQYPNSTIHFCPLDLADISSIQDSIKTLLHHHPIDILINNAALMAIPSYHTTSHHVELQWQVNVLGHVALTCGLYEAFHASTRLVWVGSLAHHRGHGNFSHRNTSNFYTAWGQYAQTKLANIMLAEAFDRRLCLIGARSSCAHPGWASTNLPLNGPGMGGGWKEKTLAKIWPWIAQSAYQGAQPLLQAAQTPSRDLIPYYGPQGFKEIRGPSGPAKRSKAAQNVQAQEDLFKVCIQDAALQIPNMPSVFLKHLTPKD